MNGRTARLVFSLQYQPRRGPLNRWGAWLVATAVALASLGGGLGTRGVGSMRQAQAAAYPTLALGEKAPDFSFEGVDGKTYSLASFAKADVLAVVFTCNHCPTAQLYEGRIKKLAKDFKGKRFALVAISANDPAAVRLDELGYSDLGDTLEDMKIRAKQRGITYPYLFAGGPEFEPITKAYGPRVTPHMFVFDKKRILRYEGRIDDSERNKNVKHRDARNAIRALLAGRKVKVPQTKAIGCSTKWSDKRAGVKRYWEQLKKEPVELTPVHAPTLKALRQGKPEGSESERDEKFRLVNFWATWCGPCVVEFPALMEIHRQFRNRDFEVVTVAAEYPDQHKKVLRFLKKQQASGRNYIFADEDKYKYIEAIDKKWDGALPLTVLLDPQGHVIYRETGAIDAVALKGIIVKALNKHQPW